VSLPEARRNFFTKENYPQRVDTDEVNSYFDRNKGACYNLFGFKANNSRA